MRWKASKQFCRENVSLSFEMSRSSKDQAKREKTEKYDWLAKGSFSETRSELQTLASLTGTSERADIRASWLIFHGLSDEIIKSEF